MEGAIVDYADLSGANLQEATLTGVSGLKVILEGANLSNALAINMHMRNALLRMAIFQKTTLDGSDLAGASAKQTEFDDAQMIETNLERAVLQKSTFRNADLKRANLERTDFSCVILDGADILETKLANANLENTNFFYVEREPPTWGAIGLTEGVLNEADFNYNDICMKDEK
jgi:uncharacterized protein YjbI with pentapeptide repeats